MLGGKYLNLKIFSEKKSTLKYNSENIINHSEKNENKYKKETTELTEKRRYKDKRIIHEGWLNKWTNIIGSYRPRYFVLENGILRYSIDKYSPTKETFVLSHCKIRVCPDDPLHFEIETIEQGVLYLKADLPEEKHKWYISFKKAQANYLHGNVKKNYIDININNISKNNMFLESVIKNANNFNNNNNINDTQKEIKPSDIMSEKKQKINTLKNNKTENNVKQSDNFKIDKINKDNINYFRDNSESYSNKIYEFKNINPEEIFISSTDFEEKNPILCLMENIVSLKEVTRDIIKQSEYINIKKYLNKLKLSDLNNWNSNYMLLKLANSIENIEIVIEKYIQCSEILLKEENMQTKCINKSLKLLAKQNYFLEQTQKKKNLEDIDFEVSKKLEKLDICESDPDNDDLFFDCDDTLLDSRSRDSKNLNINDFPKNNLDSDTNEDEQMNTLQEQNNNESSTNIQNANYFCQSSKNTNSKTTNENLSNIYEGICIEKSTNSENSENRSQEIYDASYKKKKGVIKEQKDKIDNYDGDKNLNNDNNFVKKKNSITKEKYETDEKYYFNDDFQNHSIILHDNDIDQENEKKKNKEQNNSICDDDYDIYKLCNNNKIKSINFGKIEIYTDVKIKRRTKLPNPKTNLKISLWSLLKDCIGRDLSRICMPIYLNEPSSFLQRLAEDFQYIYLLKFASKQKDSLARLAFVAAFTISPYASVIGRTFKPFNPLLGETYELTHRNFYFIAEQVLHHPPITAYHCHNEYMENFASIIVNVQILGKSVQVNIPGSNHLILKIKKNKRSDENSLVNYKKEISSKDTKYDSQNFRSNNFVDIFKDQKENGSSYEREKNILVNYESKENKTDSNITADKKYFINTSSTIEKNSSLNIINENNSKMNSYENIENKLKQKETENVYINNDEKIIENAKNKKNKKTKNQNFNESKTDEFNNFTDADLSTRKNTLNKENEQKKVINEGNNKKSNNEKINKKKKKEKKIHNSNDEYIYEHYTYQRVNMIIHNIIFGKLWVELHGNIIIRNHSNGDFAIVRYMRKGWFEKEMHKVQGIVCDRFKNVYFYIYGIWSQEIYVADVRHLKTPNYSSYFFNEDGTENKACYNVNYLNEFCNEFDWQFYENHIPKLNSVCVWRAQKRPKHSESYYGFNYMTMELNEITEEYDKSKGASIACTDSRFRPDQRNYENGNIDIAILEKQRLENKQRQKAKMHGPKHVNKPKWFYKHKDPIYKENDIYLFNHKYWKTKYKNEFSDSPDIF